MLQNCYIGCEYRFISNVTLVHSWQSIWLVGDANSGKKKKEFGAANVIAITVISVQFLAMLYVPNLHSNWSQNHVFCECHIRNVTNLGQKHICQMHIDKINYFKAFHSKIKTRTSKQVHLCFHCSKQKKNEWWNFQSALPINIQGSCCSFERWKRNIDGKVYKLQFCDSISFILQIEPLVCDAMFLLFIEINNSFQFIWF